MKKPCPCCEGYWMQVSYDIYYLEALKVLAVKRRLNEFLGDNEFSTSISEACIISPDFQYRFNDLHKHKPQRLGSIGLIIKCTYHVSFSLGVVEHECTGNTHTSPTIIFLRHEERNGLRLPDRIAIVKSQGWKTHLDIITDHPVQSYLLYQMAIHQGFHKKQKLT